MHVSLVLSCVYSVAISVVSKQYEAKASCMKSENQDLLTELSNLKEQSQLQSNEIQKLRSEIELKTQSWEQEKQSLLKDVTSERRVSVDHFERFPNCKVSHARSIHTLKP